jgi:hypothetical protein
MADRHTMHAQMLQFVAFTYEQNTDPDFDIAPMLHANLGANSAAIIDLPKFMPPPIAARIAAQACRADAVVFVSAFWTKRPDTREKDGGEGVMIVSETKDEQEITLFAVTRDPLPRLTPIPGKVEALQQPPMIYEPPPATKH